jgi:protein-tyrosine phosphatase
MTMLRADLADANPLRCGWLRETGGSQQTSVQKMAALHEARFSSSPSFSHLQNFTDARTPLQITFVANRMRLLSEQIMTTPYRILFVCMGNICRSPAAHGVMESFVKQQGLSDRINIDSAGTGGWHEGELPDHRMRRHAAKRGYELTSRARQVRTEDFEEFDLILVMDQQNLRDIRPFAPHAAAMQKVKLFCEFVRARPEREVPDPYYGGTDGFEQVLDLVENGCHHLLAAVPQSAA